MDVLERLRDEPQFKIVDYCAKEVDRQGDGPQFVSRMFNAWQFATLMNPKKIREKEVKVLGMLVKGKEVGVYRQTPATFWQGRPAVHHEQIQRLMAQMLDWQNDWEIQQTAPTINSFTIEFLRIHPFEDGNGRVASLLHNLLCGTLENPHPLPEYEF